jgi:hypothetical protein
MQNVKHVIFEPGGKNLLLDISSTNIDTFVLSLYHCVETRSISFLTVIFAIFNILVINETFGIQL